MKSRLIAQGAEAKIILKGQIITKDRIPKSYRIKELDKKIRKSRTKAENKLLRKASQIINVPLLSKTDSVEVAGRTEDFKIIMPYVDGKKLSDYLDRFPLKQQKQICKQIGEDVAKLHDAEIIHGDLTTSNMIVAKENKIFFLDFGLAEYSEELEKRGMDLLLMRRSLQATHYLCAEECLDGVINGYATVMGKEVTRDVIKRVEEIARRGRYSTRK